MNPAQKIINYVKESQIELKKVVWPTRTEALRHTVLVIALSLGVAFFLGAADFVLNFLIELFLQR